MSNTQNTWKGTCTETRVELGFMTPEQRANYHNINHADYRDKWAGMTPDIFMKMVNFADEKAKKKNKIWKNRNVLISEGKRRGLYQGPDNAADDTAEDAADDAANDTQGGDDEGGGNDTAESDHGDANVAIAVPADVPAPAKPAPVPQRNFLLASAPPRQRRAKKPAAAEVPNPSQSRVKRVARLVDPYVPPDLTAGVHNLNIPGFQFPDVVIELMNFVVENTKKLGDVHYEYKSMDAFIPNIINLCFAIFDHFGITIIPDIEVPLNAKDILKAVDAALREYAKNGQGSLLYIEVDLPVILDYVWEQNGFKPTWERLFHFFRNCVDNLREPKNIPLGLSIIELIDHLPDQDIANWQTLQDTLFQLTVPGRQDISLPEYMNRLGQSRLGIAYPSLQKILCASLQTADIIISCDGDFPIPEDYRELHVKYEKVLVQYQGTTCETIAKFLEMPIIPYHTLLDSFPKCQDTHGRNEEYQKTLQEFMKKLIKYPVMNRNIRKVPMDTLDDGASVYHLTPDGEFVPCTVLGELQGTAKMPRYSVQHEKSRREFEVAGLFLYPSDFVETHHVQKSMKLKLRVQHAAGSKVHIKRPDGSLEEVTYLGDAIKFITADGRTEYADIGDVQRNP